MKIKVLTITIGLLAICSLITYTVQYFYNIEWFKGFGLCGIFLYLIFIVLSFIVLPSLDKNKQNGGSYQNGNKEKT